jgi:hypothetical protein
MWEAWGIGKPKIRRFLQECKCEGYLTDWSETKISFFSSTFEINGDGEKLEHITEYLKEYKQKSENQAK